jgi:hypothetical protein
VEARAEELRILSADGQGLFREAVGVLPSGSPSHFTVEQDSDGLVAVVRAERTRPGVSFIGSKRDKGRFVPYHASRPWRLGSGFRGRSVSTGKEAQNDVETTSR